VDVTICVGTYGHRKWVDLAHDRAIPSAIRQDVPVIFRHEDTLADARNSAIRAARTDWVIVLDADDELGEGYVQALGQAHGDLRAPALVEILPDGLERQVDLTTRDMDSMNPCCIGTAIRREMALDVGGFWPEPAWEDFSLFRRAWLIGATIEHVPGAVYRASVRPGSRNRVVRDPDALMASIKRSHEDWMKERHRAATDT